MCLKHINISFTVKLELIQDIRLFLLREIYASEHERWLRILQSYPLSDDSLNLDPLPIELVWLRACVLGGSRDFA